MDNNNKYEFINNLDVKTKQLYPNIILKTKTELVINQINWNIKNKWSNNINNRNINKKNIKKHKKKNNNTTNNNTTNNNTTNNNTTNHKTTNNNTKYMYIVDNIKKNLSNVVNNNQLINAKNQIELYYNKREWDCVKKITNPFELIYVTSKYSKKHSISLYEPLSRSYFKMIEMIYEFLVADLNHINNLNKIKSLHLAEGPGGFMEAFINYRNNKNDIYYGMTLKSINNNIPGWAKSDYFIKKHQNLNLITGIDNMGDLYNINNHYYVMNRLGRNSMDVITGDGGFDFSVDFNLQEQYAQKLIYSQIIMGFEMLKKGGIFICKLFDTFTTLTTEFIFLLYLFYDKVYIYKPYTSRLANSERYIICKGYKGISTLFLYELIQILDIWNEFDNKNKQNKETEKEDKFNFKRNCEYKNIYIESILHLEQSDYFFKNKFMDFKNQLNIINETFQIKQINNINTTINIIKSPPNEKWYNDTCKEQIKIAIQWCKKYNIPHKSFVYNLNYKNIYDF